MNFKLVKSFLATAVALGALVSGIVGTAGMPAAIAASTKPVTKTATKATAKPKAKASTKATAKPQAKASTKVKPK